MSDADAPIDGAAGDSAADEAAGLVPLVTVSTSMEYLRRIWDRRDFMFALPVEELRSSHRDTLLGNVWHLGNPLITAAVYYVIFGVVLSTNRGIDNYPLWLMVGVFAYGLTASTVLSGASSISQREGLMRSFRFPRAIVPIASSIGQLITFAFQLGVLAALAIGTGEGVSRRWLALPVVLVVHSALNFGGALVVARLNDTFRDVQQLIPFLFRLLQFTSGVMFSADRLTGSGNSAISTVVAYNPLIPLLNAYRWCFMGGSFDFGASLRATVVAALLLVFGFRYFRAAEHRYGRA